jgi:hypothetical protein
MRVRARQLGAALCAVVGIALAGSPTAADHRDFAGKVSKVSKKRVTIENRQGDRRSFVRGTKTKVRGRRSDWDGIRPGDKVIIDWHLEDRPARARRVRVIEGAPEGR